MNCSRFGFVVTFLFVITSLFRRKVLCMQNLESVEVDSSVPLTHHDPKDLGSWFSKATQNPFSDSFRF